MNIRQKVAAALDYTPKYCRTTGCSQKFGHDEACDGPRHAFIREVPPSQRAVLRAHGVGIKTNRNPKPLRVAPELVRRSGQARVTKRQAARELARLARRAAEQAKS